MPKRRWMGDNRVAPTNHSPSVSSLPGESGTTVQQATEPCKVIQPDVASGVSSGGCPGDQPSRRASSPQENVTGTCTQQYFSLVSPLGESCM